MGGGWGRRKRSADIVNNNIYRVIDMFIDKQSPVPAYYQIKHYILEQITSGNWKKDVPIPSERELSELAKVSRMTVRQAINELVNEGMVYRLKGKGTYITKSKIEQKNIMSFSDMAKNKGLEAVTKLLIFEKQTTVPQISQLLGVADDTHLYRIKRLRKAGDIPVAVEEVFIPQDYCPEIERFDLTGSLYKILLEQYQHKIEKINVNIEAIPANHKEHEKLLEVTKTFPLLRVSGNSITHTGLALFHEISHYRSDQFSYQVSIFNRHTF